MPLCPGEVIPPKGHQNMLFENTLYVEFLMWQFCHQKENQKMTKNKNYNLTKTRLKNKLRKLEDAYYENVNVFMTEDQFINEK